LTHKTKHTFFTSVALFISVVAFLSAGAIPAYAQMEEYSRKAIFIERALRFFDWPGTDTVSKDTITIGFLGSTPIESELRKLLSEKKQVERVLRVTHITAEKQLKNCDVIFFTEKYICPKCILKSPLYIAALDAASKRPILTVCDIPILPIDNIILSIYRDNNRLRFAIDQRAAEVSGISISSYFLNYARIVNPITD